MTVRADGGTVTAAAASPIVVRLWSGGVADRLAVLASASVRRLPVLRHTPALRLSTDCRLSCQCRSSLYIPVVRLSWIGGPAQHRLLSFTSST